MNSLVSPATQERIVKSRERYYRAMLMVALLTAGAVIYGLVVGHQDRQVLKASAALLVECTTDPAERKDAKTRPGEDDCFIRAQNRTAAAVSQIGDISVVAAACGAANPGDVLETRRCVEEALTE